MQRAKAAAKFVITHLTVKRLVLAAILYWVPIALLAKLIDEVQEQDTLHLDAGFLHAMHAISNPVLDFWMMRITNLADFPVIALVLAIILFVLVRRKLWRDTVMVLASVGGAVALNLILKVYFHRQRPQLWDRLVTEQGYSFPSGHAMMSTALAVTVVLLLWPTRWRWLAVVVGGAYVLLIGTTRMYLGVHFPTDVLAGWCVSLLWVLIVQAIVAGRWVGMGPRPASRRKA